MESITHRPTLGEGDDDRFILPLWMIDRPIFLRKSGKNIHIQDYTPVVVKRHFIDDIHVRKKLIFLIRNPYESILSHTRDIPFDSLEIELEAQIRNYYSLVECFELFSDNDKLLVRYEDLIMDPQGVQLSLMKFVYGAKTEGKKSLPCNIITKQEIEKGRGALQRKPKSQDCENYYRDLYPKRAQLLSRLLLQYIEKENLSSSSFIYSL